MVGHSPKNPRKRGKSQHQYYTVSEVEAIQIFMAKHLSVSRGMPTFLSLAVLSRKLKVLPVLRSTGGELLTDRPGTEEMMQ